MFADFVKDDEGYERCGLFLGTRGILTRYPWKHVEAIVELPNRAEDTSEAFVVAQADIDRALTWLNRTESDVFGFWHTHPAQYPTVPSQEDIDGIALGHRAWWHCVYACGEHVVTWFNRYEKRIVRGDTHGRPDLPSIPRYAVRPDTQPTVSARMGRVHGPE